MSIIVVVIGVAICVFSFLGYLIVGWYYPEWIGLSGRKPKVESDTREKQQDRPKDFFSR
jgi:hypothetical protein